MKQLTGIIFLAILTSQLSAQAIVSGRILNTKKEPVAAASVTIKETGAGVNADTSGVYKLETTSKGRITLIVSSIGYNTKQQSVTLAETNINLDIVLKDQSKELGAVVVSAGTFEASDKAKGASLTPMDAVTVAGSGADIANSLRSLPGAQQIGEREGLFVRGGTSEEAKQFVDGTLLKNPNFAPVPGILQPARLNPFLFKGILFNTGGYSALYGNALSSALILETVDLPEQSEAGLHIFPMSLGAGFQKLSANKKSGYGITTSYNNYKVYNQVVEQRPGFFHDPEYLNTDANFRIKTSKTGILKFYVNHGYNHTGMSNPDVDSAALFSSFENKGTNIYSNLSYHESLGNNWGMDAALAYNYSKLDITNRLENADRKQLFVPDQPFISKNGAVAIRSNFAQARFVATKKYGRNQAIRFGAEHFYNDDRYSHNDTSSHLVDGLTAAFAETDVYIAPNVAAKVGLRSEYSSLFKKFNLAPRLSLGYRLNDGGQFNIGYGIFYQMPELVYLLQNADMGYTKATHYILNYQKKANNRLIRIEAYYKKYNHLVTTSPGVANEGSGYAKGIELFFRDKKTFKDFDYWVTYTYLDTKRRYLNYPGLLQPDFATPHTASIAIKKFFPDLSFSANLSYAMATGRPYYDIRLDESGKPRIFDSGKTNMFSQMNLSFAYLFTMFKKWKHQDFSGIGFGMNNVFGTRQIFGYNYSSNGLNRLPVTQPATRSFYIGIFMSFGIDRRDDFINDNL